MNDFEMTSACSPFGLLAGKIVERAILDWRQLARGKSAGEMSSKEEIKLFLRGTWCEALLSHTDIDGEWVLDMLEKEVRTQKKRRPVTIDGKSRSIWAWCNELGIANKTGVYSMYDKKGHAYVESYLAMVKEERGL